MAGEVNSGKNADFFGLRLFSFIIKTIKILMLCADKCREDNFCSFWSYEENINTKEKKCSLLSTCEKTPVDPSPILTFSGAKECYPEQEKRRKCQPGCPDQRKFCHGRCVPAGIGQWRCLFGTCSASPFRTSTESCFELAFQEEEENCHQACSWTGQEACQVELERRLCEGSQRFHNHKEGLF